MEHLLLKAATTATTDQGEFTAIAAAYSVDRVKDRIVPGAFKTTIERWQASGKQIPLHWNHEGDAKSIIGSIDPSKTKETDQGLYVEGKLDLADSEIAREAWRSMKNGSMSLSFGYVIDRARKAKDGIQELLAIDLFEVSIVPAPANADTRVLSLKAMSEGMAGRMREMADMMGKDPMPISEAEMAQRMRAMADEMDPPSKSTDAETLRKQSDLLEREIAETQIPELPPAEPAQPDPDPVTELQEIKARLAASEKALEDLTKKAEETDKNQPPAGPVDPLRKRSDALALEVASGGMSLRKPPPQAAKAKPDPVDLDALRQSSRDLMFEVLSYSTE